MKREATRRVLLALMLLGAASAAYVLVVRPQTAHSQQVFSVSSLRGTYSFEVLEITAGNPVIFTTDPGEGTEKQWYVKTVRSCNTAGVGTFNGTGQFSFSTSTRCIDTAGDLSTNSPAGVTNSSGSGNGAYCVSPDGTVTLSVGSTKDCTVAPTITGQVLLGGNTVMFNTDTQSNQTRIGLALRR